MVDDIIMVDKKMVDNEKYQILKILQNIISSF